MGLTEEQAIALHDTEFWKDLSYEEIAHFQLFEERLCMPFDIFHEAIEKTLGRPVFTHEFASKGILEKELLGEKDKPSFKEILEIIPKEKRIIVHLDEK